MLEALTSIDLRIAEHVVVETTVDGVTTEESIDWSYPLVTARDGAAVARLYSPSADFDLPSSADWNELRNAEGGPPPIGLLVPEDADHRRVFVEFLRFLHWYDPESVPIGPPRFPTEEEWLSPEQTKKHVERSELSDKVATLEERIKGLDDEIRTISEERRDGTSLLFDDGDSLSIAVRNVLADLGFQVVDLDAQREDPNQPRHGDLQVSDTTDGWIAIAEVKGYSHDAKVNDLAKVNKHVKTWSRQTGKVPDGIWWVFNDHRRNESPSERPASLRGHQSQLTNADVVGIPTRALFRMWRDVQLGYVDNDHARQVLKDLDGELLEWNADS